MQWTGPAAKNIRDRTVAKRQGRLLNDKGLWEKDMDGEFHRIDDGTEQSICDALGIPYLSAPKRESYEFYELQEKVS